MSGQSPRNVQTEKEGGKGSAGGESGSGLMLASFTLRKAEMERERELQSADML